MSMPVSQGEDDGMGKGGGMDLRTFAKGGGTSSSGQHPTWASALLVQMVRLRQTCWQTHHPFHSSSITCVETSLQRTKREYPLHLRIEIVSDVSGFVFLF